MNEADADADSGMDRGVPLRGRDRWLWQLALVSFLVWFLLVLWAGIPGPFNLLAIPIVVLGGPTAAITLIILSVFSIFERKPRRALSLSLIALLPPLLWNPIFWAAACAHIVLTVGLGVGQFRSSISPDGRFATYDWSVGLVSNVDTFLIYDATDEIALPANKHRHPLAIENGFGEQCAGRVTHLLGHYYECSF